MHIADVFLSIEADTEIVRVLARQDNDPRSAINRDALTNMRVNTISAADMVVGHHPPPAESLEDRSQTVQKYLPPVMA